MPWRAGTGAEGVSDPYEALAALAMGAAAQLRPPVPRIYYASRTHSQIEQVWVASASLPGCSCCRLTPSWHGMACGAVATMTAHRHSVAATPHSTDAGQGWERNGSR